MADVSLMVIGAQLRNEVEIGHIINYFLHKTWKKLAFTNRRQIGAISEASPGLMHVYILQTVAYRNYDCYFCPYLF